MTPSRDLTSYAGVLFDLDGVLTPTAEVHTRAWKRTFDEWLERTGTSGEFTRSDYLTHVDGKPRYDGVRDFLSSRGVTLPEGDPTDDGWDTVCGIGNRKDALVNELLETEGVAPYPGSVDVLDGLVTADIPRAVVSSSRNAAKVLRAAGIDHYFRDADRVDGIVAAQLGLPGKPAPDTFVEAANRLDIPVAETVVVEDAVSGVQAGRAGGFGLVVGVDRGGHPDALRKAGADVVVDDLAALVSDLGSTGEDGRADR